MDNLEPDSPLNVGQRLDQQDNRVHTLRERYPATAENHVGDPVGFLLDIFYGIQLNTDADTIVQVGDLLQVLQVIDLQWPDFAESLKPFWVRKAGPAVGRLRKAVQDTAKLNRIVDVEPLTRILGKMRRHRPVGEYVIPAVRIIEQQLVYAATASAVAVDAGDLRSLFLAAQDSPAAPEIQEELALIHNIAALGAPAPERVTVRHGALATVVRFIVEHPDYAGNSSSVRSVRNELDSTRTAGGLITLPRLDVAEVFKVATSMKPAETVERIRPSLNAISRAVWPGPTVPGFVVPDHDVEGDVPDAEIAEDDTPSRDYEAAHWYDLARVTYENAMTASRRAVGVPNGKARRRDERRTRDLLQLAGVRAQLGQLRAELDRSS